ACQAKLEELASAVRADIDPRCVTARRADDLDASSDRAEAPFHNLGAHGFLSSCRRCLREGRPAEAAPLRPSPIRWEIDAAGARHRQAIAGRSLSRSGRGRTMFSMPLAYPSTLDHRPLVAHMRQWSPSYVEGLWSPILGYRSWKSAS